MYRENANKPAAGKQGRESVGEKPRSEKQREKVKDVRSKEKKKRENPLKRKGPRVEREMKMNE